MVGGGIIGLEMASVYQALGSRVTVVELTDQLMPGADPDLVKPLQKRIEPRYDAICLGTKVTGIEAKEDGLHASFEGEKIPDNTVFDRVLVSIGRAPNGNRIGADTAGVEVTDRGFIPVDRQMRTNVPHIFAIGDIVGQPMLAHKATHEAKVAAEVCAGEKSQFDARVIPSVAYTDPEVAWVGLTELEAKERGVDYGVGKFPWAASGRALGNGRAEGFTKLLFDNRTHQIIGAGIVGTHAGDLIAEACRTHAVARHCCTCPLTLPPPPPTPPLFCSCCCCCMTNDYVENITLPSYTMKSPSWSHSVLALQDLKVTKILLFHQVKRGRNKSEGEGNRISTVLL